MTSSNRHAPASPANTDASSVSAPDSPPMIRLVLAAILGAILTLCIPFGMPPTVWGVVALVLIAVPGASWMYGRPSNF